MEKKKSDLTNLSHDKKAQAGSSPELSSVFEEMKNGIDIQPLEDIMPEYDQYLDEYVYSKIWAELSPKDKEILRVN